MLRAMEYTTLAAADLGSNSFHLEVGRVDGDQVYPLDSLKETVRLGGGITPDRQLDPRRRSARSRR
jgi:exopolyphosphatase/guanosine-5'-triphosphate,3'-diphosphate pyrophosphatase